jgi:Gas vesicle protein K
MDRESAERSLVALVLSVVELLRQLMERQAIRRVDQGDLCDDQVGQIGDTLMALDQRCASCATTPGPRPARPAAASRLTLRFAFQVAYLGACRQS